MTDTPIVARAFQLAPECSSTAYRRGAQDMLDHTFQRVSAGQLRELEDWLRQLEGWEVGNAHEPPIRWKMT